MQIEELLHSDISCSIALPRLPKRVALEDSKLLKGTRISVLDEDWDVSFALLRHHCCFTAACCGPGARVVDWLPLVSCLVSPAVVVVVVFPLCVREHSGSAIQEHNVRPSSFISTSERHAGRHEVKRADDPAVVGEKALLWSVKRLSLGSDHKNKRGVIDFYGHTTRVK